MSPGNVTTRMSARERECVCVWGEPKVNKQNFRRDRDLLCKAQQKNILHFTGNCCAFFPLSSFPRVLLISAEPEGETQSYLKLRRRFDPSSNTHTHTPA